jgi:hypothetical protein
MKIWGQVALVFETKPEERNPQKDGGLMAVLVLVSFSRTTIQIGQLYRILGLIIFK